MQAKRKARKKVVRKMQKRVGFAASLDKLAKTKLPKWRVVEDDAQDATLPIQVDAVSPKLSALRSKTRTNTASVTSEDFEGASDSEPKQKKKGLSGLVNMAPESGDAAGVKTQVFEDDEHTGSQG
jgi:hypothetical protein